ncbi:MAG: hypothetical protein SFV54_06410 [Bryobacteraceae bacterium]|nr:hypothetical protein [Bryobacteraceae bacterium]
MVIFATGTFAQWRDDDWGRRRDDGRWPGQRTSQQSPVVVDRVLSRLERSQSYYRAGDSERKDFEQARRDLVRFRENWYRGRFDKDRLDGAIDHLKDLAESSRIHPRERQMFMNDVYALRDFRASGGRYNGGGYGAWPGRGRYPDSRWPDSRW